MSPYPFPRMITITPQAPPINDYHPSIIGGARGVVIIAVGNEHGDTSSNPGRD